MCTPAQFAVFAACLVTLIEEGKPFTSIDVYKRLILQPCQATPLDKEQVAKEVSKAYAQCRFPAGWSCLKIHGPGKAAPFKLYRFSVRDAQLDEARWRRLATGGMITEEPA